MQPGIEETDAFILFIFNLAVPGLSSGTQDPQLRYVNS